MQQRLLTRSIVVHCSASRPDEDWDAETIRRIHVDEFGWEDIGYHFVVRRSGAVESGRPLDRVGAHVKGHNGESIGICMVGGVASAGSRMDGPFEANFTAGQFAALAALLADLSRRFPGCEILGHRDFPGVGKACPCFDVRTWWSTLAAADEKPTS